MSGMDFYPEWVEKYHVNTTKLSECVEQWDYLYQKQKGQIFLCRPWPGIMVWANKVFMDTLPCETAGVTYPFVKLNYCIRGRCEVFLENGKYIYLSAGMLSIDRNQVKEMFRYPTREYEGLEIVLNLAELEKHPLTILDELGTGTAWLQEFTRCGQGSFISGVSAKWDVLARNLVGLLETAKGRVEDYRFYSLELLYFLAAGHTRTIKQAYVTSGQRRVADEAEKCICRDLKTVYTVEQLARNPKTVDDKTLYELYESGAEKENWQDAKALAEQVCDERRTAGWLAGKLLEQDAAVLREISIRSGKNTAQRLLSESADGALYTSDCKFQWIEGILKGAVSKKKEPSRLLGRFDRAAISTRWGKPIAVGILLLSLVGSMVVAMPVIAIGGVLPGILNSWLTAGLSSAGVSAGIIHFIESAFVTAIGWVVSMLGFVFGINLVFGLVEEVGYMARVSYAFDGTMGRLGLQGKAIMPVLTGFGCTIGGAAGTRVMDTWGQRILTMAVVWAVPCGATFAVIPTLAAAFFGWGGILVMVLIFAIMFVHILLTAKVFGKKLNPKEDRTGLIMELPPYHKPRWGFLLRQALIRVWGIFKKAFSIEIIVCAVFYFLSYSSTGMEGSLLYKLGVWMEPVTKFFGMGWQTFMSFIASMVSKEAVLGVLSAIFANSGSIFDSTAGTAAAVGNVGELASATISQAEALAFMIAVTFNVPCLQAVVSTYQESHSLKWTLRIAAYYIGTALILSCVVYHVAVLLT